MKQKLLRQIVSVLWIVAMLIVTISVPNVRANNEGTLNHKTISGSISDAQGINTPNLDINAVYTNTYYVDNTNPSALDSNPGTDPGNPLRTISRGAYLAGPGDLVYVMHGSYSETVLLINYHGVDGSPITFSANSDVVISGNGSPTLGAAFYISQSSYITVDGFHIEGTAYKGIFVSQSDNITISNNYVTGTGQRNNDLQQPGIHFQTVVNSTIDGNISYDNSYDGIKLTLNSNNNIVSNNTVYGNYSQPPIGDYTDATGIMVNNSDTNLVIHNFVYDNEDSGINLFNNSNNNVVVGNVSYGNLDHGIDNNNSSGQIIIGNTVHGNFTSGINLELFSGGATVMNNIVMDNGLNPTIGHKKGNIYVDAGSSSGTILDFNLYYRSSGSVQIAFDGTEYSTLAAFKLAYPQEVNGLESNPLFVAPAPVATETTGSTGGDYHLSSGSPAIDSANSDAPEQPLTDIEGNPRLDDPNVTNTGLGIRTYDDRGAYERQSNVLHVTGITADNKVYNGNTSAVLNTGNAELVGVEPGDTVQLVVSGAIGTFADADVADGITVIVSGLTITGGDALNYTLTQPTTTANITPKPITVTADSGLSKMFAADDPVFTYTYLPNDPPVVFSGLLSRDLGEAIGQYAITIGTLSAGDNYEITFIPATFTITGYQLFLPMILR